MINESLIFVNSIKEISVCDSKVLYFTGSTFSRPTDFNRIECEKHNHKTCEKCTSNYKSFLERHQNRHSKFPNCCDYHKNLAKETWFQINDFDNIPKLTTDKVFYSWDFINEFIDNKNWEEEITDYLSHVIETFGSFPDKYGEPLFLSSYIQTVIELINFLDKKNDFKKKILINYLSNYNNKKSTDFNVLLNTYDKWYKTFPFEISIFSNLKAKFSKTLPIFEKKHFNKYSNQEILTPLTKSKLISFLCDLTNQIITNINSFKLYEEGKLTDVENYKLELLVQNRKLKVEEGYHSPRKNANDQYRKMLKDWYTDETEFIKGIESTLSSIEVKKNNLYNDVLFACGKMQENNIFWNSEENLRTKQILDLLELSYGTKDQSQIGVSSTKKRPGSIDGIIIDRNKIEYIIEALNLSYLNRTYIQSHISKLESNYDSRGLITKFLISYCNIKENSFEEFYNNYAAFIDNEVSFNYLKINSEKLNSNYSNQRIIKTTHERESKKISIYHILLKMPTSADL